MSDPVTLQPRPYLLANRIQPYAWGEKGANAFIPRLLGTRGEAGRAYAELWMGAHPSAPSDVVLNGEAVPLLALLQQDPGPVLGEAVAQTSGGSFPFLFKVLSAGEALSIQVHPNAEQARRLHAQDPAHYPDPNHKPEVAIALDSLIALAGFRSFPALQTALEAYPELSGFVDGEVHRRFRTAREPSEPEARALVRELYTALMTGSLTRAPEMERALATLAGRLRVARTLCEEEQLFLALSEQYPGDVGLFSLFFLNLVHLRAGQGIFIDAGVPHAYLRGNIIECMAASDNVVRAGLTGKFKDVETLVRILTYELGPVPILEGCEEGGCVVYRTPAREFQVSCWTATSGAERLERTGARPRILLVTEGEVHVHGAAGALALRQGQSALIPAVLEEYTLRAVAKVQLFTAQVPGK